MDVAGTFDESIYTLVMKFLINKFNRRENSIQIIMGNKKLQISTNELLIKEDQIYIFKNQGMLRMNNDDIYDVSNRGDIIVKISLI